MQSTLDFRVLAAEKEVLNMKTDHENKSRLKAGLITLSILTSLISLSGIVFAEETETTFFDGNLVLRTGTINETNPAPWDNDDEKEVKKEDMGDYIAVRFSKDAWFFLLYGNEENHNGIMMATFQLRYLGGATVKDSMGNTIVEKIGIPVITVYGHKFFSFIEFQDVGYREKNMFMEDEDELIGAGNNLWDFKRTHDGIQNMDNSFISAEPVIKALDLNTSWKCSEIIDVESENADRKDWEFSLTAKNLSYGDGQGKIWDPEFVPDGTSATLLDQVTFTFHLNVTLDRGVEINDIPWYDVEVNVDDENNVELMDSHRAGERDFTGISVNAEYKYDHYIKGWDFKDDNESSKLMLESFSIFATVIPDIVNDWFNREFVTGIDEALGVAEYDYYNAGNIVDTKISDPVDMPTVATQIAKEHITFRDNWHRVGELSWISDVEVDGENDSMYYQVHAGHNQQNRTDKDDAHFFALVVMGGYIYPVGGEIFHDPTFTAVALIIDDLSTITLNVLSGTGSMIQFFLATLAVIIAITIHVRRKRRQKKDI